MDSIRPVTIPGSNTTEYTKPPAEWQGKVSAGNPRRLVEKEDTAAVSQQSFTSATSQQEGLDTKADNVPSLETTLTNSVGFRSAVVAKVEVQPGSPRLQSQQGVQGDSIGKLEVSPPQLARDDTPSESAGTKPPTVGEPANQSTPADVVVFVDNIDIEPSPSESHDDDAQAPVGAPPQVVSEPETVASFEVPPAVPVTLLIPDSQQPAKGSIVSLFSALRRPSLFPEMRFSSLRNDEKPMPTVSSDSTSRFALVTLPPPKEPGFIPPLWHPAIPCLGRTGTVIKFQSGPNMNAGQKAKITVQNGIVRSELLGLPTLPGIYSDLALLARPSTLDRSLSSAAGSSARTSSLDRSYRPVSTFDRSLSSSGNGGNVIKSMNGPAGELKLTAAMAQARLNGSSSGGPPNVLAGSLSRRTSHRDHAPSPAQSGRFSTVPVVNDSQFTAPLGTAFTEGYLLGCSPPLALEKSIVMVTSGSIPEWLRGSLYLCGPVVNDLEATSLGVKHGKPMATFSAQLDSTSILLQKVEFVESGSAQYECRQLATNISQTPPKQSLFDRLLRRKPSVTHKLAYKTALTLTVYAGSPSKKHKQPLPSTDMLALKTDTGLFQIIDATTLRPPTSSQTPTHSTWNPHLSGTFGSVHARTQSGAGEDSVHVLQRASQLHDKYHLQLFTESSTHPRGGDLVCALDVRGSQPLFLPQVVTTTNYLVLIVCPTRWAKFGTDLAWDVTGPTYFYIVDRKSKKHMATYRGEPMHFVHVVNAFDMAVDTDTEWSDVDIVVDVCASRSPVAVSAPTTTEFDGVPYVRRYTLSQVLAVSESQGLGPSGNKNKSGRGKWWRKRKQKAEQNPEPKAQEAPTIAVIPPTRSPSVLTSNSTAPPKTELASPNQDAAATAIGGSRPRTESGRKPIPLVRYDVRSGPGIELPVTNPNFQGKASYQYLYGVRVTAPGMVATALVKINVQHRASMEWQMSGCLPGGPVVVPRPGASAEDDAVVLSVVLDTMARRSFVLVLDAQSFREVARVSLGVGQIMPFAFHGIFVQSPLPKDEKEVQRIEGRN